MIISVLILLFTLNSYGFEPNWNEGAPVPTGGRTNPYLLNSKDFNENIRRGRLHALYYPVKSTLLLPYEPFRRVFDADFKDFRKFLFQWLRRFTYADSFKSNLEYIGLLSYPETEGQGPYFVPFKNGKKPHYPMGFTYMKRNRALGFSISCANCHSGDLFGRKIIGLTNRFPRGNEAFVSSKKALLALNSTILRLGVGATKEEAQLFEDAKNRLNFIESSDPKALGLDASLSQVALSLSRREKGPYALRTKRSATFPRREPLRKTPANSKPAVWWNIKYKNKWLSDGSIVSGNPIYTNLIWNEIGRGADLKVLETWFNNNAEVIKEITTAVFSSTAPRIEDFFDMKNFDLKSAMRGEKLFVKNCSHCHGIYQKEWSKFSSNYRTLKELIQTTKVIYHKNTFSVDVGTDSLRWKGMKSLLQLNDLEVSKKYGVVIKHQKGYVPPPLVGIWARWPYFHNNSIPSLCALLTRPEDRPKMYWSGPASDTERDFDFDCNGYPNPAPVEWTKKEDHLFETSKPGLSNIGHAQGIFMDGDIERFSQNQKQDLIRFLQTL